MPNSHGVVAENNPLLANVDLGDFLDPLELILKFADRPVMIPQYKVDLLAPNPLPACQRTLGPTMQKSPAPISFATSDAHLRAPLRWTRRFSLALNESVKPQEEPSL